jgi:hypothetical protein
MTDAQEEDAHDLMPVAIAQQIPPLYATEQIDDPPALLKWFTPDSSFSWYVLEYDPDQRLCFGLVVGAVREIGYFSLDEVKQVHGHLGLRVERDLYWQPKPLSECE